MNDSLVYFGGAVKVLDDNGRIGGIGIRFSSRDSKDLSGEYFTAKTYLGPTCGDGQECIFHHGIPLGPNLKGLAGYTFAPAKATRQDVGIFVETCLDLSDEYEKAVFQLVKKGKLGWSSGAAGHRVTKNSDGEITAWPVAEWSLTPQPCEPKNYGSVIPIKSLDSLKFVSIIEGGDADDESALSISERHTAFTKKINQHIDDIADAGTTREQVIGKMAREAGVGVEDVQSVLAGEIRPTDAKLKAFSRVLQVSYESLKSAAGKDPSLTIKGIFADAIAEEQYASWKLWDTYSKVIRKLAAIAESAQATGVKFDLKAKVDEATGEYAALLTDSVMTQIADYIDSESDDNFYLKSLTDPSGNLLGELAIDMTEHSQLVESAVKGLIARFRRLHETRKHDATVKAGRVLSDKNRSLLAGFLKQMQDAATGMQKLLDESQPMASETEKRAAIVKNLLRKNQQREMGVSV